MRSRAYSSPVGRIERVDVRGEEIQATDVIVAVPWFSIATLFDGDRSAIAGLMRQRDAHGRQADSSP